eukprot:Sspe_Gene.47398::Locus_24131_Transcript_1_1_Confidence_1.000_Length_1417::g.47398::m.47398/K12373/HEXA_B; hexosaminidase
MQPWKVEDRPRFTHREVLVDTARHFEPVKTLKNMIDSFTYAKVNTMHWHLVDSQSFPLRLTDLPEAGADGGVLQRRAVLAERRGGRGGVRAAARGAGRGGDGTPGHAQSWCKGHPEICPSPSCNTPLNPATNATFDLIEKLWKDITRDPAFNGTGPVFDRAVHIGGDEVNTKCYERGPGCGGVDEEDEPDGGRGVRVLCGAVCDADPPRHGTRGDGVGGAVEALRDEAGQAGDHPAVAAGVEHREGGDGGRVPRDLV